MFRSTSAAVRKPELINEAAFKFGSQCVVCAIDAKRNENGWEVYPEETRAADFDSDRDGMPDWWEKATGSNPDIANANDYSSDNGWTRLEEYLDFMAHPYVVVP